MNRLHLRIYEPPAEPPPKEPSDAHDVLPFTSSRRTTIISGRFTAPVDRARIISENAVCPECEKCDVEPLELQDAIISTRSRQPIPGTATIVGFHCNDCGMEWPLYELKTRRNG